MIDAFNIFMALTLVVAGLFLCRDYARFLRSSYTTHGRVASIQQVFLSRLSSESPDVLNEGYVKNGFYPVIEYKTKEGAIAFTAIDSEASGRFHVGDDVRLRFFNSRRRENRTCKTAMTLGLMLVAICASLLLDMAYGDIQLSMNSIFLASGVLAICFAILVSYARDCDEHGLHGLTRSPGGKVQLSLFEPTAFCNWNSSVKDRRQLYRIRNKQFFGATCVCSAMLMVAMTV